MDSCGWKVKKWKFTANNIEEKKAEMQAWMDKWQWKYQYRPIFVHNAWAVEYKLLIR